MNRSRLLVITIALTTAGLVVIIGISLLLLVLRVNSPQEAQTAAEPTVITTPPVQPTLDDGAAHALDGVRRTIQREVVPLTDSDSATPDLLVFTQNIEQRANTLIYLDSTTNAIRWESAPLSASVFQARLVLDRNQIYLADQTRLLALSRGDGSLLWQTSLSDTIFANCQDCLQVVDESVVVLTEDGVLQGFAAETGESLWRERLQDTPRQLLVIGEEVAVLDQLQPGRPEAALHLFVPADGTLTRQIEAVCPDPSGVLSDSYPGIYTPVFYQPEDQALYFLFGTANNCALRLDAPSGELIWRTNVTELPPTWHRGTPLLTDDAIYVGDDELMAVFDKASGELRRLVSEPDYDLEPLAARDGTVVVEATRTRGSRRLELWGIDTASGERRWQFVPAVEDQAATRIDTDTWSWRLSAEGVVIIRKFSTRVLVETINLQDGASLRQTTIPLEDRIRIWRGIAWSDSLAWVTLQRVYAIDLATGEIAYTWP